MAWHISPEQHPMSGSAQRSPRGPTAQKLIFCSHLYINIATKQHFTFRAASPILWTCNSRDSGEQGETVGNNSDGKQR
jgi:hypothetical protein